MHETAYLNPMLTIYFENKRIGEEEKVVFHEEAGISGFVKALNEGKEAVTDIISFKGSQKELLWRQPFSTSMNFRKIF